MSAIIGELEEALLNEIFSDMATLPLNHTVCKIDLLYFYLGIQRLIIGVQHFITSIFHSMRKIWVCILALLSFAACHPATDQNTNEQSDKQAELYRPQFHFTPPSGWMNDPNGMVYHQGEYHLFYQHYPDSTVWGPMHWGHAVSKDLLHWKHLPIALFPDSLGYIFSGSAVVDHQNTSGLGKNGEPPLVAIFTFHDAAAADKKKIDYQTQGLAYSRDHGITWKMFEKNPVLRNPGIADFRDPKVSWHEQSKQWIMALAVKDHIEFYSSPDLKKWALLSAFGKEAGAHGGVWECPDLFPLTDDRGKTKWVLFVSINPGGPQGGSATQYFIGDFDGRQFTAQDTVTRWIDYGADNYAGVTWSNIPASDGRRLFLGWMSNWQYGEVVPTDRWRSAMTLPREITLTKRSGAYMLTFSPAREIKRIEGKRQLYNGHATVDNPLFKVSVDVTDLSGKFALTISNTKDERVVLSLDKQRLIFDRRNSGLTSFNAAFPALHTVDIGKIEIKTIDVYADVASLEIFVNGGELVLTEIVFPTKPLTEIHVDKNNPIFHVSELSPPPNDEGIN